MSRFAVWILFTAGLVLLQFKGAAMDSIVVKRTADFNLTGDGQNEHWNRAAWNILPQRRSEEKKETKFKVLYSSTGIYFLFSNDDEVLTASKNKDFDSLWLEDVNEVFLWPDTTQTLYFEYEISPLNYELPILVPNIGGKHMGWRPWNYEKGRKIKHLTGVTGGKKESGSRIRRWFSEFFIPYDLLAPLANRTPRSGTVWKANLYRVDYDHNQTAIWSWQKVDGSFHQYERFGKMVFE